MELRIKYLKTYLLLAFCSLSWFAVAQTKNDDINLFQGEWVFEDASIPGDEYRIHIDLDNGYMKFYPEVEVTEGTVLLKDDNETKSVEFAVDGNYLALEFSSGELFIAEWAILEDKLYLEFKGKHINVSSKDTIFLLVYKRK